MPRTHLGPGPGKYMLPPTVGYPDHDISRYRNPQYSMGLKLSSIKKELGPGPKYNTEYMTTYGKAHPPAYSIVSRHPQPQGFQSPGPAKYNVKDPPRNPAYSIVGKPKPLSAYVGPGPNQYDVPTTIGPKVPDLPTSGAYSISGRYPQLSKEQSPGPARYDPTETDHYKPKQPKYTMAGRNEGVKDKSKSPGPSAYYPKLPGKGGYSFGLKTDTSPLITPSVLSKYS